MNFTEIVFRYLLAAPPADRRQTCLEWMEQKQGDRREAILALAGQLADDLAEECGIGKDQADSAEAKLIGRLLDTALSHVNYHKIANALFDRALPLRVQPSLVRPSVN